MVLEIIHTYWSNGASDGVTTEDLDNIPAGVYTMEATDENNCSVSMVVVITETAAMDISETHGLTIQVMVFHVMELVMVY